MFNDIENGKKTVFNSSIGTLIEYEEIGLEMISLTKPIYYMVKPYTNMYMHIHIYVYVCIHTAHVFIHTK